MAHDFTLKKYSELCLALKKNYSIITLFEYVTNYQNSQNRNLLSDEKICILRHDVDRNVKSALKMADIEHKLGIRSSYYFRYPYTFKKDQIIKIKNLGHEVGYHYETLSKTRGDYNKAITLFEEELNAFREICDIKTICMHGSPLSPYDNRNLWDKYDYKNYGVIGDAYLSISNVRYFSDTGRNWNGRNSLRDNLSGTYQEFRNKDSLKSTDNLISYLQNNFDSDVYLTVHPERWAYNIRSLFISKVTDSVFNSGKKCIKVARKS
ncbi:hypothetical protein [Methanoplanus endosymbiosus]|uniref:Polysaccharide deacetylase n=1 Tax=Methanoplanus endosymbiosus TaxID=33865 RepID=A0A9E7TI35_9EURY|nr:hypothetical protein [Methanoplanus endosymbiosus]UUX91813.1 hypothetical protein L6E24_10635 [Methanoplanus endosymbiosus]